MTGHDTAAGTLPVMSAEVQPEGAADPFRPVRGDWTPVNPRLAVARRGIALMVTGLITVVATVAAALGGWALASGALFVLGIMVCGWLWWLIGRQVRAIGYADRDDDLLVVSGILFKRLVVVPYGRMQQVDVRRGPVERYLGLATVQLHTAAATTDASIPGLEPAEASRLRDQLAALGEQRSAGL
jgi:membrane protein YdbS with pleckstrin-like domain